MAFKQRNIVTSVILSFVTCGIYAIYFEYTFARDMNIACAGDGKKTHGVLAQIIFTMLTFGIYYIVWMYGVGERIYTNSFKRQIPATCSGGGLLAWYILGSLIVIGPFVAMHKRIEGLNRLCADYNARQTGGVGGGTFNVNVNINQ